MTNSVTAAPEKMQNRLALKEAYMYLTQAAQILANEERTKGIQGSEPLLEDLQGVAMALQEAHMKYVATHNYDADAIIEKLDTAQDLILKMRRSKITNTADLAIDEVFNLLDTTIENVPQAANMSDDAVDDVLLNLSRQSPQPVASILDWAVEQQFLEWDVDHSSVDPYAYRDYAEQLKALLDNLVANPGNIK